MINNTKLIEVKTMENQIHCKRAYKCGICDTEYESVQDRMSCEMKCIKKQQEEEKRAAEEKRQAEQKMRKEAVDEAVQRAVKLYRDYVHDYGHYEYEGELVENLFFPSKLWHYFGF